MESRTPRVYKLRDLVSADQLAKALGVSLETVLDWRRSGGLPGYRIGKRVFFLETDLMDWIRGNLAIPS
ncbi:MAG: helix-turn-helix domain-containing protein [Chloroflexota bacterium]